MSEPSTDERRGFERVPTDRSVVFSDYEATGPLREGLVSDMSAAGLRIETRHPAKPGTDIQIELKPAADDRGGAIVLIEGRVMHVVSIEESRYAMGVKRFQRGMAASGATPRPFARAAETPKPAARRVGIAEKRAKTAQPETALPPAREPEAPDANDASPKPLYRHPTPQPKKRRYHWVPIGGLGLLFLVLIILLIAVAIPALL